jgi:hypothetical protein
LGGAGGAGGAASSQPMDDPNADGSAAGGSQNGAVTAEGAVRNVMQWISLVLASLKQMEWQFIGYQKKPDGSQDHSRPLYNIPGACALHVCCAPARIWRRDLIPKGERARRFHGAEIISHAPRRSERDDSSLAREVWE